MVTQPRLTLQASPYPYELEKLVGELRAFPGWHFELRDEDRGQGSSGLTLVIVVHGMDAYKQDKRRSVAHLFIVPAASYNSKSWTTWLYQRCEDVLRHELGEYFRLDEFRPFAPNHGAGHDPYFTYVVSTTEEKNTRAGQ